MVDLTIALFAGFRINGFILSIFKIFQNFHKNIISWGKPSKIESDGLPILQISH